MAFTNMPQVISTTKDTERLFILFKVAYAMIATGLTARTRRLNRRDHVGCLPVLTSLPTDDANGRLYYVQIWTYDQLYVSLKR